LHRWEVVQVGLQLRSFKDVQNVLIPDILNRREKIAQENMQVLRMPLFLEVWFSVVSDLTTLSFSRTLSLLNRQISTFAQTFLRNSGYLVSNKACFAIFSSFSLLSGLFIPESVDLSTENFFLNIEKGLQSNG